MKQKQYLLLTFIALLLGACTSKKSQEQAEPERLSVEVVEVTQGVVPIAERLTSQIEAEVKNNITSQSGGRLQQILVKVGDRVTKGQPLARLDASQLNQVKVNLDQAKSDYERMKELYEAGAVAQSNLEAIKSQYEIARVQYNNLLENTLLRSPTHGIVTARNYDVGDMTSVTMPILVIEKIAPVKLMLNISEQHYSRLREGLAVEVEVDALAGETFQGYIHNIYPTINPQTHAITIEVRVDNKALKLRPGMYAKAFLKLGEEESLLVPDKAVVNQLGSGEKFVYLYKQGVAEYRVVEVGQLVGDHYQILGGLTAGDSVITTAVTSLKAGDRVVPFDKAK